MSFLEKLGLGLKKTSTNQKEGIKDIFTKDTLDVDVLENLEEGLKNGNDRKEK